MLVEEFRAIPDVVGLYHMDSSYDSQQDKLKLLYKFIPGVAPQSFGIEVAKMAGINNKVLETAKKKSLEFNDKH
jgi:DNA mismatch repair protein MSH6